MIGCDKFCTYCIVPSVRGPEQSRPPEHIAAEVRQLAGEGCKEITLLGQTVNSYKYDYGDGRRERLSDLLPRIHDTPGIERIKFITNFPRDMSDDLLDAVRDLPKVCPYLHVPAQSGCNDVLKRMKRLTRSSTTATCWPAAARRVPGVAISSDFIVGFCGETEESFQRTCDLVREARLQEQLHLQVQPAARHQGATSCTPTTCRRRSRSGATTTCWRSRTRSAWRIIAAASAQTVEVLVEGPSKNALKASEASPVGTGPKQLTGRTMTDHIVVFDGNERLIGPDGARSILTEATAFTLFGTVVTGESGLASRIRRYPPLARPRQDELADLSGIATGLRVR